MIEIVRGVLLRSSIADVSVTTHIICTNTIFYPYDTLVLDARIDLALTS